jgi:hypothetical protein
VTDRPATDVTYALVAALTGTPEQLAALRADRTLGVRQAWYRFAEKALGDAWRRVDPVRLRLALAAVALVYEDDVDPRDLMLTLWPYHHAAGRLGDRVQMFDDASHFAGPEVAKVMREFGRRETNMEPAQWHWRPTGAESGPAFEQTTSLLRGGDAARAVFARLTAVVAASAEAARETAPTDGTDPPA